MRRALAGLILATFVACGEDTREQGRQGSVSREARTLLLLVVDNLDCEHLTPYGYGLATTPHLKQLADEAILFKDHVTACTGVNGSLASLLTGQYAQDHGVGSLTHRGQHALAADRVTLAEVLADAGWSTFGAVSLPQLRADLSGLNQGFAQWASPALHEGVRRSAAQVVFGARPELREALAGEDPLFLLVHLSDPAAKESSPEAPAAPFLESHLGPFRASRPLIADALDRASEDPKAAIADMEQLLRRARGTPEHEALRAAQYDGQVAQVDAALGELLELLRQSGRLDQATIVVTATRGTRLASPPAGASAFPPALVRTPLMIRFPGGSPTGPIETLVRSVDLAPTLADSLGLSMPAGIAGRSLLPLLELVAVAPLSNSPLAFCETATLDRRGVFGPRFSVEENRVAGTLVFRRENGTRVLPAQLEDSESARIEDLRRALTSFRRPADLVVENAGLALDVRWIFGSGFAGPARVESPDGVRAARTSGLSGSVSLTAEDERLVIEAGRRELPLSLLLSGVEGLHEKIMIGDRPLDSSLIPRLPARDAPPWPTDSDGALLPAAASLEHQGGTWWKLRVGEEGTSVTGEFTALIALYPPGPLDERLEWSAGPGVEVHSPPGREDVVLVRGEAPCTLQLEKKPSQSFGLALHVGGHALSGEEIRLRERQFSGAGHLGLYVPDWIVDVTDDLLAAPDTPFSSPGLRITRRGPNLAPAERQPMNAEQRTWLRRLGGGE